MRTKLMIALLATALSGPALAGGKDNPSRGLESVNVPVVTRSDYAFDAAAPDGSLPPAEQYRLDAWFAGLNLGYGDRIYVEGAYADAARSDVARLAGRYGLLVSSGAPVSAGVVSPGGVRVVVSRTRASVPNCPNWREKSQPNFANHSMSNYGCGVNSNMAAMIADPNDFVWGREGTGIGDAETSSRAIRSYRNAKPTGENGLLEINTKKDSK
ncbi:CpaD family pilus assembly lipoprotein [Sphingomonas sp.]|uniref:CpaD family pilus assembly protein n=1 Tax=Sphingomonas sp. TaxID=28214 RepID=UPI00286BDB26|nr:CpaD family pilus assembly lipoprotein [Sphingomonas sp.]